MRKQIVGKQYKGSYDQIVALLKMYWIDRPKHGQVDVYLWEGVHGLRVAEVSFSSIDPETKMGGGSSFMQVDQEGGTVCFFTERAIIETSDPQSHPDLKFDHIDAQWRMILAAHGEDAAAKFAKDAYPKNREE